VTEGSLSTRLHAVPGLAFEIGRGAWSSFFGTQGTRQASQLAFHLLLAGPAALVFAIWVFSNLSGYSDLRQEVVAETMSLLPLDDVEGRSDVRQVLDRLADGAGRLGVLTVPVLLFSVSSALSAIRYSVDTANDRLGDGPSFVRSRFSQMLIVLVGVPLTVAGATLLLSGALGLIFEKVPLFGGFLSSWVGALSGIAFLWIIFGALFYVIDRGTSTVLSSLVGGLSTAIVAFAASQALRLWFGISGGGGPVYGSLAAFIGLLIFAYLFSLAIVIGAHVMAATTRQIAGSGTEPG
jgi:uncharacterized BrkB/YihY/UPF0761 family membrane protein